MKLPQLDTFSASLPQLKQKRAELLVNVNNLKSQCAVIRARMHDAPNPGNAHEVRLREILGETTVAVSLPDSHQLRKLQKEIELLNAAIATIDREIQTQMQRASIALIESVGPEIKRLGTAFAKAFADLHDRHQEFDEFVDSLEDAGASVGQFRIRPNGLSNPKDLSGSYAYGLKEFIDSGFFSKSNMPKAFR